MLKERILICMSAALAMGISSAQSMTPAVDSLQAVYRDGQVFLTWHEAATPAGTTFNVYAHTAPVTQSSFAQAVCIAHHIEQHSARDWWQDTASFEPGAPSDPPVGFVIQAGTPPLDPSGGLFVHTIEPATAGAYYYAVTCTLPDEGEQKAIVPGANSLHEPVVGQVAQVQPIWLESTPVPAPDSARGGSLTLVLHGRGGGKTAGEHKDAVNCLWFASREQGWREGLPFKFHLRVSPTAVTITPKDRTWMGRPISESKDRRDYCPAVNTWWYGYPEHIYKTTMEENAIAPNYTERYLLSLVQWAQEVLGTDPNATYIRGGSMGGSGSVAMALHFPHVFAAAYAQVPVYSCTRPGKGSAVRLECLCGPLSERVVKTADGIPLLDHMNGTRQLSCAKTDTPPIFATNGRTDASIPWENNPPFYAATNETRQAFAVFWNNGAHGMSSEAPDDVKAWGNLLANYRLDRSYPAFSSCSDNRNYGNGDPKDGDLVGWINRGLAWKDLIDESDRYEMTVIADHPEIVYPVSVDVTPRRIQSFKVVPGQHLQLLVNGKIQTPVTVDASGHFTITGVTVDNRDGTRIALSRKP